MILVLPQVEKPHQAVPKILKAIDTRNAEALYPYLREEEALAEKLTRKKLGALLAGPFSKRMNAFKVVDQTVDEEDPDWITIDRTLRAADGRKIGMFLVIRKTPEGPKLTPFLQPVLHAYFNTWIKPGSSGNAWSLGATKGGPALDAIGMRGFRAKVDGTARYYTWAEWAKSIR